MKITPDDPRLTAYALGELSEPERSAVQRALEADESLKQELAAMQGLSSLLGTTLGGEEPHQLGDDRREEIFASGKRPDAEVIVLENRRRLRKQSFMAIAGVAAAIVVGFYFLSRLNVHGPGRADGGAGTTDPTVAHGGTDEPRITQGTENEEVSSSPFSAFVMNSEDLKVLRFPLHMNTVDLASFQRELEQGKVTAMRVEEWVNTPEYFIEPEVSIVGVGVTAEMGACPWDQTKNLLMIVVKDLEQDGVSPGLQANLIFESARVKSLKFLTSIKTKEDLPDVQRLADGTSCALLYEIELLEGEARVGAVDLRVQEKSAYLPIFEGTQKPSLNYQTAVALAQFVQWQNGEEKDPAQRAAMMEFVKELLEKVTEAKARYALDLILMAGEGA